jgi:hypothetical protein
LENALMSMGVDLGSDGKPTAETKQLAVVPLRPGESQRPEDDKGLARSWKSCSNSYLVEMLLTQGEVPGKSEARCTGVTAGYAAALHFGESFAVEKLREFIAD